MRERRTVNVNDIRDLVTWWARCTDAARHFDEVRACALNGLAELTPPDRERVLQLVAWLEAAIAALRVALPGYELDPDTARERIEQCRARERCIRVAVVTHQALTVFYGGDAECLRLFARGALKMPTFLEFEMRGQRIPVETLPVFSRALVESLLEGAKAAE